MLCYRDRCYCDSDDCENYLCTSRITEEVIKGAERVGLPIDQANLSKNCPGYTCQAKKLEI